MVVIPFNGDVSGKDDFKAGIFNKLLMASDKKIYVYILTLVPNRSDADDIMQEVVTTMWRRYDEFIEGKDFAAWGIGIARNKIFENVKKKTRSKVIFNDELLKLIEEETMPLLKETDQVFEHLQNCVNKLEEKDRMIIGMRYSQDCSVGVIADQIGKSLKSAYRLLSRINSILYRCVKRNLFLEEA